MTGRTAATDRGGRFALPLGPVVQHTGELGKDEMAEGPLIEGAPIEEVWVFGAARQEIDLSGLPPGVRVRHW